MIFLMRAMQKKTDSGRKEHGSLSVIIFVFYCSTEQLISDVQLISALSDSGLCSSMLDGKKKDTFLKFKRIIPLKTPCQINALAS